MKSIRRLSIAILLFCALPLLCLGPAWLSAELLDCTIEAWQVHPCPGPVGDMGQAIYIGVTMGWLGLITGPVGALVAASWIGLEMIHSAWRR